MRATEEAETAAAAQRAAQQEVQEVQVREQQVVLQKSNAEPPSAKQSETMRGKQACCMGP